MHKVTLLTMVHNGERFIEETIKSVLNQSEPDFRYFIRLNACTDRSEEIVRKYAAQDDRIVVFKNERNFYTDEGIHASKRAFWPDFDSEYIAWLDHDDILHPDFLKNLYQLANINNADMAVAGCSFFDDKTGEVMGDRVPPTFHTQKINDIGPFFPESYGAFRTMWGKLFRTDWYDQYYEEIRKYPKNLELCLDTYQIFYLMMHTDRIASLSQSLLYYRVNQTSQFFSATPQKTRIGEGKVLFDTAMQFLKCAGCATKRNVEFLHCVHGGHMIDLINVLRKSPTMSPQEVLDYLQAILNDDFLKEYRNLAVKELYDQIDDLTREIFSHHQDDNSLNREYLFRYAETEGYKIQTKDDLLWFLSATMCKENSLWYGFDRLTPAIWLQIPALDRERIKAENPWLSNSFLRVQAGCLDSLKRDKEQVEAQIAEAMETDEWVKAFELLQELEKYTLVSETGLFCRLMILLIQGKNAEAQRFSYAARALQPESQAILNICSQLD